MYITYFLFVVLLSTCGLRSVDCAPSFTGSPNSGNPVYQLEGQSVSLTWSYNPDGRIINQREWVFNGNQRIATILSSGVIEIDAAYASKAQVLGNTLTLLNIQEKDSGIYEFVVQFTTFNPRWIVDDVQLIVVVAPQITQRESAPITIDEGNTRTLLCVASGNPKPLITWYRDVTKIQEEASNSNYTITSAKKKDAGRYRCLAKITAPGLTINTAEYAVDVTVRFKPEHTVNSLSSNQTVLEGRDAEFYCQTDAVPGVLEYRWFKDGIQISNFGDYTITQLSDEERLTVKQAKKSSAGQYSCDGRNALGFGEKKSAYLLVNYAPQQIIVTPTDLAEVALGQSITLTCQADGFPKPSYSWKFNGVLNGITQNTLTITNADVNDAGNYTCLARNGFGSNETTKVVYVRYAPTVATFTTGTPGNAVVEGTTVTLTCSANGYPAPTYIIKRGTTPAVSNGGKFEINNVQLGEEENEYSCETQNAVGSGPPEIKIRITVLVPPTLYINQLPTKQTKTENETVSYSCRTEAKPAATILWQLNGENLTETPPYNYSVSFAPILQSKLLKTLSYLTINRVTWRQHGNFSCLVYNDAGEKSQATELEVRYRPVVQSFADHPKNITLDKGATARFTCKTIGNPPTETHKWQFNGKDISGESCSGCSTTTYVKTSVTLSDAGWYSCTGTNSLGEGPPARAQLLVKYAPEITFYESSYTVKETSNVTLVCRAKGVPQPRIIWTRSDSGNELANGEQFLIVNTTGHNDGSYRCTARNDIGEQDSVDVILNVQTRPTIVTSTPTTTQIPGAAGEQVDLTCIVNGKPLPSLSWKRDLNAMEYLSLSNDEKVESITLERDASIMKVVVTKVDEKFYCIAVNLLGSDTQQYTIRERGVPDAPINMKLVAFKVVDAKTVSVNVSWTPGYSGGYDQVFTIHYRVKGTGANFVEQSVGHPDNNMFTIEGLLPETEYEFTVQASNQAGKGEASASKQVTTPVSSVPPDRGSVQAARMADDATVILVTWTVTDIEVTTLNLEMQEGGEGAWEPVPGGSGLSTSETELKVNDLDADKSYKFRMDMRRPGEKNPVYVLSNTGVPDAPINMKLVAFKVVDAKTVSVNVSWTPGYSGGYDQVFTIHYRVKGTGANFVEQSVGHPDNNMFTIEGLLPETEYEFTVQASNQAGKGEASASKQVTTPVSSVPPDRGSVQAARMADDATVILVTWTVTDIEVTTLNLEMQEGGEGAWEPVPGGSGLSTSETELKVNDLDADKSYKFRMDMRRPGEKNPVYVLSNTVAGGAIPRERGGGEPLQDWMIAVIAGVAGVLLLAIVVLALCCFKRRKKAHGADNVNMSQTSNYAVGGPDVAHAVETRRSYGMESVEDDPFIAAASMQSMTSNDGKKKKQDPSVNYGYLSQDSVQQPEMLLNPGSRMARNSRLAQSTGELDMNSAYPARGPQRDFNTLPPYHEPPSFEEAMRQSSRKPKTRKSTGDLTGPGQGRHSGRRPRQARPADEPTDSSDGEQRFTPQRTAPPPPRVRHVESIEEPRYAPVDQQPHVMGPRVLPVGPPANNGPRGVPLDPSVPYALPQRKNKPKKPRHEPAIDKLHLPPLMHGPPFWRDSYKGWPPPQYTPEDLSPEDPMLRHPGDLDLDDPSSLPLTERPPVLPPPMAMLPSNRPLPSNYHDDALDGLPEPPAFLRDIVYPTDSDRDPRYDSDGAMPYHPPSPGRQRQPYINVHGQLVRPDSQDSDGFRRPESLRSSRNALTPEPEMPPNQWRSRGSESVDNRGAPEMNYVSYLV